MRASPSVGEIPQQGENKSTTKIKTVVYDWYVRLKLNSFSKERNVGFHWKEKIIKVFNEVIFSFLDYFGKLKMNKMLIIDL